VKERQFARKSGAVAGVSKRDRSRESEDGEIKSPRGATERVGPAIAYRQADNEGSDGHRLYATAIGPVTFSANNGRLLLDTGGDAGLASFFGEWAETFESESGAVFIDVQDIIQQADASLVVRSREAKWEVVNEGSAFFTIYRPLRLEFPASDDPAFIAFHFRNDNARARAVKLLPSQHTQ
jgi:hypothetical protein